MFQFKLRGDLMHIGREIHNSLQACGLDPLRKGNRWYWKCHDDEAARYKFSLFTIGGGSGSDGDGSGGDGESNDYVLEGLRRNGSVIRFAKQFTKIKTKLLRLIPDLGPECLF